MNILMFNYMLVGVMCNYVNDLAWWSINNHLNTLNIFFPIFKEP